MAVMLIGGLTGLGCGRQEVLQKTFYPMGGIPLTIKAYDVPSSLFDEVAAAAEAETERLERVFSCKREDSELALINRNGSGKASPELVRVLLLAGRVADETTGAFDATVLPVIELWHSSEGAGREPTEEELSQRLELVDWRQVSIADDGLVHLKKSNMAIDLGGIAKGFIADELARDMKKRGIKRGLVDAGGNVVLFNSLGEQPFKVGIKDPDDPENLFGVLTLDSGGISTSGCYERSLKIGDRTICHILDPKTGKPVGHELISVTIVAEEGAAADALSTAVMVMGRERGQALINSLPGVEGILIWKSGDKQEWWVSSGLHGRVSVGR
jgi:thiamine biosynthesis lipoprotein